MADFRGVPPPRNRLHELPASIGGLRSLRELWLHGNQLRALPEELGNCASLTVLQAHRKEPELAFDLDSDLDPNPDPNPDPNNDPWH